MREEFEKLPEIETHLAHGNVFYSEEKNVYVSEFSALHFVACYVSGAWMAWQEQQKRVDASDIKLFKLKELIYGCGNFQEYSDKDLLETQRELKKILDGGD